MRHRAIVPSPAHKRGVGMLHDVTNGSQPSINARMDGHELQFSMLDLFPELQRDLQTIYTSGLVPFQEIKAMIEAGQIRASVPVTEAQLQPASIDLRLGPVAYQIPASFLPTE